MPIDTLLNPPALVGDVTAGKASEVRRELLKLNSAMIEMTFDLAELLVQAKQGAMYQAWGFKTFEDYVADELDLKVSRAYYLIRIVQVCALVGIERAVYEIAGVAKLRVITRLDPNGSYFNQETQVSEPLSGHIKRLVGIAKGMTLLEVVDEVKRLMGMVGENDTECHTYSWSKSTYENVIIPAQELARRNMGTAGRDEQGNAIEFSDSSTEEVIHQEFLNDAANYTEEPDESQAQTDGEAEPAYAETDIKI